MDSAERKIKPSSSEKEVDILIEKVNENAEQLSEQVTNKKKKNAWTEVQNYVNASSFVPRTLDEIKTNGMTLKEYRQNGNYCQEGYEKNWGRRDFS